MPSVFPSHQSAQKSGLLCFSQPQDFSAHLIIHAYSHGIFPWPDPSIELIPWFSPWKRGVLFFEDLHIAKSLKRWINSTEKNNTYSYQINVDTLEIIDLCQRISRPNQTQTWITEPLLKGYKQLFDLGYLFSLGVYKQDKTLVAGIYGILIGSYFSAESMFHLESNTSKWALIELMHFLNSKGVEWIDIQMLTPVTEALGGQYIHRKEFLKLQATLLQRPLKI